jgi:glycosyltransferase involved in cell wall biosynthesis
VGVLIEIIVVDDASTDSTLEVIEDFLSSGQVKLIKNSTCQGGAEARNIGVSAASGRYIAFQDSDDEWLHDKLFKQVATLEKHGARCPVNFCRYIRIEKENIELLPAAFSSTMMGDIFDLVKFGNFVTTQTLVLDRQVFVEVGGFDKTLPRYQDWDLVLRLADRFGFSFVDEPLVVVYDTPGNLTSQKQNDFPAKNMILNKWRSDARMDRMVYGWHYFVMSRVAMKASLKTDMIRYAGLAVSKCPFKAKYHANLLYSLFLFPLLVVKNAMSREHTEYEHP